MDEVGTKDKFQEFSYDREGYKYINDLIWKISSVLVKTGIENDQQNLCIKSD